MSRWHMYKAFTQINQRMTTINSNRYMHNDVFGAAVPQVINKLKDEVVVIRYTLLPLEYVRIYSKDNIEDVADSEDVTATGREADISKGVVRKDLVEDISVNDAVRRAGERTYLEPPLGYRVQQQRTCMHI